MTALEVVQAFYSGITDGEFQSWAQTNPKVYDALPDYMMNAGLMFNGDRSTGPWLIRNPKNFFAWIRSCGLWSEEELVTIDPYVVMALAEDTPSRDG